MSPTFTSGKCGLSGKEGAGARSESPSNQVHNSGSHGYLTSLIHIYICMYTCLSVRMRSTIISFFFINIKNSFDWSQILVLSCQTSDSRKNKNHPRSSLFLPSLLLVLFDRLLGANSVLYGVYIILIELIRYTNLSIIKFTKHNSF